jgi:uncharacterized membrane protein
MFGRRKAMVIRPPPAWGWEVIMQALRPYEPMRPAKYWADARRVRVVPEVRHIGFNDLKAALVEGFKDLDAFRTDVIFLCVIYPVIGLVLARLASGHHLLPLVFPLVTGFALVGPFAAVGLNEMSRRREQNLTTTWGDNFAILCSPALAQIVLLGLALIALLTAWLISAQVIYDATLGPDDPVSLAAFARDVVGTTAGWTMIVVAFPMMLDRNVTVDVAIRTSVRVVLANKRTMAVWGLIVAALLVVGSIPALLGLVVVMPVLGHATWHLYRAAVPH